MVFSDSKSVEALKKDGGLWNSIVNWMRDFLNDLREAFTGVEALVTEFVGGKKIKKKFAKTLPLQNAEAHTPEARAGQTSDIMVSSAEPEVKQKLSTRDNEGNTLSEGQQRYFADSKVRDENGNLMVVYHGTNQGDFTEFKWEYTQWADGGFYGRGHYFTTIRSMAAMYGNRVIAGYANIVNPFVWEEEAEPAFIHLAH